MLKDLWLIKQIIFFAFLSKLTQNVESIITIDNNDYHSEFTNRMNDKIFGNYRINKGGHSSISEFQSVVSILSQNNSFICGGIFKEPSVVVTAAHCVVNEEGVPMEASSLKVYPNYEGRPFPTIPELQTIYAVKTVFIHPKWEKLSIKRDLAVLMLEKPFDDSTMDSRYKGMIRMVPFANPSTENYNGTIKIAGFGKSNKPENPSLILRKATLQITTPYRCMLTAPDEYLSLVTFCAQPISPHVGGPCYGDDGGPVLYNLPGSAEEWQVLAIITEGKKCDETNNPKLFTMIDDLFLKEVMAGKVQSSTDKPSAATNTKATTMSPNAPTTKIASSKTSSASTTSSRTSSAGTTSSKTSSVSTTPSISTMFPATSSGSTISSKASSAGTTSSKTFSAGTTSSKTSSAGTTSSKISSAGTTSSKTSSVSTPPSISTMFPATSSRSTTSSKASSAGTTSSKISSAGTTSSKTSSVSTTPSISTMFPATSSGSTTSSKASSAGTTSSKKSSAGTTSSKTSSAGTTSSKTSSAGTTSSKTSSVSTTPSISTMFPATSSSSTISSRSSTSMTV